MRTLEDDMRKVRGYVDEADARRRQPAPAAAPGGQAAASEPALRLVSPDPIEPVPPSAPPGRDQLSLF
jgi:hypothetical protein